MPEDTTLKPCPFCGCKIIKIRDNGKFNPEDYGSYTLTEKEKNRKENVKLPYYAICLGCGARSDLCEDVPTVFEIWNTRAE